MLTKKYAEGHPGKRTTAAASTWMWPRPLAIARALELFGAEHANVQPHSGPRPTRPCTTRCSRLGDTLMGLELATVAISPTGFVEVGRAIAEALQPGDLKGRRAALAERTAALAERYPLYAGQAAEAVV